METATRIKLAAALVLFALVAVVVAQNSGPLTLHVLFWSVLVDLVLLLIAIFLAGLLAGLLTALALTRRDESA